MARILIVDDDEADRLIEEAILERAGHEIVFATDGGAALAACSGDDPVDLVITDLQMPEVHGFELITVLRGVAHPPPVIAVSGTGPYQLEMAEALGAKFTLSKPVDPHQLLNAVEQVLRFRRAPDQGRTAAGGE